MSGCKKLDQLVDKNFSEFCQRWPQLFILSLFLNLVVHVISLQFNNWWRGHIRCLFSLGKVYIPVFYSSPKLFVG